MQLDLVILSVKKIRMSLSIFLCFLAFPCSPCFVCCASSFLCWPAFVFELLSLSPAFVAVVYHGLRNTFNKDKACSLLITALTSLLSSHSLRPSASTASSITCWNHTNLMEEVQVPIILPTSVVVEADEWSINQVDKDQQGNQQTPDDAQLNIYFFPSHICTELLHSGRNSRLACHPAVDWTLFLLQQHFWWPSMATDTRQYTSACSRNKRSHRPPSSLLHPLLIPQPRPK